MPWPSSVHALPWSDGRPGAHVVRAASAFLLNQVESGVCCPLAMTFAAPAALGDAPALASAWLPKILSTTYDPRPGPAADKSGVLVGMAMTEKQGGSDVRANTTAGTPARRPACTSWSATNGFARHRLRMAS